MVAVGLLCYVPVFCENQGARRVSEGYSFADLLFELLGKGHDVVTKILWVATTCLLIKYSHQRSDVIMSVCTLDLTISFINPTSTIPTIAITTTIITITHMTINHHVPELFFFVG